MTEEFESGEQVEAAAPVETSQESQQGRIPLEALQAERQQRQALQDEVRALKDHLQLMQAQGSRSQEPRRQDPWDTMDDGDVLTVGEAKKFIKEMNNRYEMSIEELRMTQKYPDYRTVVTKYLPDVIKANPRLAQTLEKTQDYELAYFLATNSDEYKRDNAKTTRRSEVDRIIENAERSGSLASAGASVPVGKTVSYSRLSDEEFRAMVNRNMGNC